MTTEVQTMASVAPSETSGVSDKCPTLIQRAYAEYCRRSSAGERLHPDEFAADFPAIRSALAKFLHIQLFLQNHANLVEDALWPREGQDFWGFHLIRLLGQGSFSRVFLARELALGNRLVALKISQFSGAEPGTLGKIHHPNIVAVHSVQNDPITGLTAICMPFLGQATLADLLDKAFLSFPREAKIILEAARKPLPQEMSELEWERPLPDDVFFQGTYLDGVRHLAAQLAEALAFIHRRGILHRDLKPSNVLLTPEAVPMLLDFNLSVEGPESWAPLGGTLAYMSPEQLLAWAADSQPLMEKVGAPSDIFSLGIILYQLFSGHHPFGPIPGQATQDVLESWHDRLSQGCRPLAEVCPALGKTLARWVDRCLAYAPQDRPQAQDLARALRKKKLLVSRLGKWAASHLFLLLLGTLLSAGTLGGAAWLWSGQEISVRNRGLEAYQQHQYSLAIQHWNRILEKDPHRVEIVFARARAFQKLGLSDTSYWNHALADFKTLDVLQPEGKIKAALGYCLHQLGLKTDQSGPIHYYRKAIELGFETPELCNNLAACYLDLHQLDQAQLYLERALRLNPQLPAAHHHMVHLVIHKASRPLPRIKGKVNPESQKDREALLARGWDHFQKAVAGEPDTAKLWLDGARIAALALDKPNITPCLIRAIELGLNPEKIQSEPLFQSLKTDPDFQALNRRVAIQPLQNPRRILDPLPEESPFQP